MSAELDYLAIASQHADASALALTAGDPGSAERFSVLCIQFSLLALAYDLRRITDSLSS
ncbi:MAG: hypothetical protein WCG47_04965 [Dermatophilaceae bacterium]